MTDKDQRIIDKESRNDIINTLDENYFVEAGAGSGKTTVLVERMVSMVKKGYDISKICAITFTKAAANEFYARFQKRLIEESIKNEPGSLDCKKALNNIDLAFMGTIDSFCNMVMSEHPNEGLIPSNAMIIDDDTAKDLYAKEYNRILNGEYNDSALEEKAQLFINYDGYAQNSFVSVLSELLSHRDCEYVIPNYTIEDIDVKYSDEIKTVRKIVKKLCDNPDYISSTDKYIQEVKESFNKYKNAFKNSWNDNISYILKAFKDTLGNKNFRLSPDKNTLTYLEEGIDYFIPHYSDKAKTKIGWYEINPDKLPAIIKDIEENKYAITIDFVNSAKDKVLEVLRRQGYLTFNDYLVYLRDTLKQDAKNGGKLIKHIYERHKYFMIDEFQDTDPIQVQIFFYLTAKDIKENWQDCVPHKGSLFIVGDPKQSIYRFKNADVASYLKIEQMFKQPVGEVLFLHKNFRSTYTIRNWFNETFSEIFVKNNEQAAFENIPLDSLTSQQIQEQDGFSDVYKYEVQYSKMKEDDPSIVKDIILKLRNNYEISEKIKHGDETRYEKRKLDWKDFMLITPTKSSLSKYAKVFRQYGIPYFVEGNIDFYESKAFEALVMLYGAITNVNDNRYLYSILKSKFFNITDKELIDARTNGLFLSINSDLVEINISKNLEKALNILKDLSNCIALSPSSLFNKLIEETKAFHIFGSANMEYVFFALELLKNKEISKEIVNHKSALIFFEELLYENTNQERCPGLKKDGNQVHLANLHKVKGLEAPVVILGYPSRKKKSNSFRIERTNEGNLAYIFKVSENLKNGISIDVIKTDQYNTPYGERENESIKAENLRLEYVGATRAKNILIIGDSVKKDKSRSDSNPWLSILNASSSANIQDISTVLATEKNIDSKSETIDASALSNTCNILEKNKIVLTNPINSIQSPSKLTDELSEYIDLEINEKNQKHFDENNGDTEATIRGTIVHRLMELMIMSNDSINKNVLIKNIIEEHINDEFNGCIDQFKNELSNVYDVMHNGGYPQESSVPQDILKELIDAEEKYSEVPFTYKEGNTIWNGIIDFIYKKDGKYHIIDWKTNKNSKGLDEHYKKQLDAYIKVSEKMLNEKIEDALIYHIDINNVKLL